MSEREPNPLMQRTARMARGWRRVGVLLVMSIAGCESDALIGATFTAQTLANAEYKWRTARLTDYTFVSTVSCFCPAEYIGPLRVQVRAGQVTSVVNARTGVAVQLSYRQPIDSLFPLMRREIAEHPTFFSASYDERLGFPRMLKYGSEAADAGAEITINDLVALSP
jgi:Family of unknown function (DUF6174)